MKAVLISLKREWWEKMLSGEKTLEIRKTTPRDTDIIGVPPNFTVFVHISGETGIQGKFICDGFNYFKGLDAAIGFHCLTDRQLYDYGTDRHGWYNGWNIKSPRKFAQPIPLNWFGVKAYPQSWCYCETVTLPKLEREGARS